MAEGDSDDAQAARDAARGRLAQVCGLSCKRITNSDDRGGVCFAQLSVRRIEVRGKKKSWILFRVKGIAHAFISALQWEFSSIPHLGETLRRHIVLRTAAAINAAGGG